MNLLVKSPVWDDLREIGLHIAAENPRRGGSLPNGCQGVV
jgi:hypothetical protein